MNRNPRVSQRLKVSLLGLIALGALAATGLSQEPAPGSRPAGSPPAVDLKKFRLDLLMLKTAQKTLAAEREATERKLKKDLAPPSVDSPETLELKLKWTELMRQISGPPVSPPPRIEGPPSPKKADSEGPRPLDPLRQAEAYYKSGDYAGALKAFGQVEVTELRAEERVPIQYLIATCLRRLGKTDEAEARYREVANSRLDPVMAEFAQWQLATMRWRKDTQAREASLKQRLKALESAP
jgi:hypothetical protein